MPRFLNLWIKDLPFKLDHLPHLPGMFFLAICKPLLMIKVAINMCCSILRRGLSLAWNRMAFILSFAFSRSDGRQVLIYITISVLPLRVQHVRLFRVYWPSDRSADVNFLESRALVSFKSQLSNSRMDVRIDNKVRKSALDDDGCRLPQSTRLSKNFIVIVEIRTSAFKLSTCLRRIIPLTSLRGSVRIWTVCFLLGLGYLWNVCSVLIHSI